MKLKFLFLLPAALTFVCGQASGTTLALDFNSLPSAQGWTFNTSGPTESSIFSVDGTTLHQDSLGTGIGPGGTAFQYYTLNNVVDPTKPFTIEVRARVLQSETGDLGGFDFGAFTGNERFGIFLDTNTISDLADGVLSASIDTTIFHLYRLDATPGIGFNLFVDGTLVATGASDPISQNQLYLGDATSGGNARADIASYTFQQTVPEPATLLLLGLGLVGIMAGPTKKTGGRERRLHAA